MIHDTSRLANDINTVISTLYPDADMMKLSIRMEEVLVNYEIHRKSEVQIEQDILEKVELYLSAKKLEGLSKITLTDYRSELRLFSLKCKKAVSQINTADVRGYLSSIDGIVMSTLGKKLIVLKSFFGWLVKEEIILKDPTAKIMSPKIPKRLPKSLSISELELVRESCKTLRERFTLELFYSTGCRLSEIVNMNKSDVDMQSMSIRVIGKGDKERNVYLSPKANYHMSKYLESRKDNVDALLVTERKPYRRMSQRAVQNEIDRIEKASGLTQTLTPHVFRRTFAGLKLDANIDLADLQSLMGHSSPETTLRYGIVSEERKSAAFKRFHIQ